MDSKAALVQALDLTLDNLSGDKARHQCVLFGTEWGAANGLNADAVNAAAKQAGVGPVFVTGGKSPGPRSIEIMHPAGGAAITFRIGDVREIGFWDDYSPRKIQRIIEHLQAWQAAARQKSNGGDDTPIEPPIEAATIQHNDTPLSKLNTEARAIAVLSQHPDWSVEQIAKEAGTSKQYLCSKRMTKFRAAREAVKSLATNIARGSKSRDGQIEAIGDEDLDFDEMDRNLR